MPSYLGLDLGTSSIKAAIWNSDTGKVEATAQSPLDGELPILSPQPGWAEQSPETWWQHCVAAICALPLGLRAQVEAIGVSYQMHGLVLVDSALASFRNAIIWCDSRAAESGAEIGLALGEVYCSRALRNSPGNFTAAKLKWVAENEPLLLSRARYAMLPGDYIALRLIGEASTTASGVSEMILWDFEKGDVAWPGLEQCGAPSSILPPLVPTFGPQGELLASVASHLGLKAGIPITYRAGDQPNNALALGCLDDGDVAATAGTSGVVYGVASSLQIEPGKFNTFLHVNHSAERPSYGLLLCLNGCGSLYRWLRQDMFGGRYSYEDMNALAAQAPPGSDGLLIYPFGNGAERILAGPLRNPGASFVGLDFARHGAGHLCRAAQEGIAFALRYGMESGISASRIRAGNANLFQSPVFAQTFANLTGASVEIWDTDGASGAARGAAIGAGLFPNMADAFKGIDVVARYEPKENERLESEFEKWKCALDGTPFSI